MHSPPCVAWQINATRPRKPIDERPRADAGVLLKRVFLNTPRNVGIIYLNRALLKIGFQLK